MKYSGVILFAIIILYGLMYIATSVDKECENCEKFEQVRNYFLKDSNHIQYVDRCFTSINPYDSLCVSIKDSTARDWDAVADSICMIATQNGLPKRHVFIINYLGNVPDTLVIRHCP